MTAPPPIADLDAEERDLGQLLLAGEGGFEHAKDIAAKVADAGLAAEHFYFDSWVIAALTVVLMALTVVLLVR